MKLKVFCVYDSKVEDYMQPFFMRTNAEAIRSWIEIVNDPNTQFHKHPGDFTLFELAEYDSATGRFDNLPTPRSHGVAIEFSNKNPQLSALTGEGVING